MNRRSRSTLFLMEQLIVVATFAICAAACVRILTASYFMATKAKDTSNAIRTAENWAECYKAVSGDIKETAVIFGVSPVTVVIDGADAVVMYYDKDWHVCSDEKDAEYILRLVNENPASGPAALRAGQLSVVAKQTGEEILAFSVAARGDRG